MPDQQKRLADELSAFASTVTELAERNPGAGWAQRAVQLVEGARTATDVESGWMQLNEARRAVVPAMNDQELAARILSLRAEASAKLGSWRKKAAEELLDKLPSANRDENIARLQEAMSVVQEHYNNEYRKLPIIRTQVTQGTTVLAGVLILVIALTLLGWFKFEGEVGNTLLLAMIAGLLGGALSVAVSFLQRDPGRIPKLLRGSGVNLSRPIIGAGTATAAYLYLLAGLLSFNQPLDTWVVAGFAFLAGFSERWFLGIVAASEQKTGGAT